MKNKFLRLLCLLLTVATLASLASCGLAPAEPTADAGRLAPLAAGDEVVLCKFEGVSDEENLAIWTYAEQIWQEWNNVSVILEATPNGTNPKIVSDDSQFDQYYYCVKGSASGYVENSSNEGGKTRTLSSLKDFKGDAEPERDIYGGFIVESMKQPATGFFTTKQIDGRWWYIDPLGYPYIIIGINGVGYAYASSKDQTKAARDLWGGDLDKWGIATTHRMREGLGFNTTTNNNTGFEYVTADPEGLCYQKGGKLLTSYAATTGAEADNAGSSHFSENNTMPVFDPAFVTFAKEYAKEITAPHLDDPRLIGWTSDNELPYGDNMLTDYLTLSVTPDKPFNRYSFAAAWTWLRHRTGKAKPSITDATGTLNQEFRAFVYNRYYSVVVPAYKEADPNHLYMGDRYLRAARTDAKTLKVTGYWVDVISFNWYRDWTPDASAIQMIENYSQKPYIITEFYAKADDMEGDYDNAEGAGWYVKDQAARGVYYENFVLRQLETDNCVGWYWFQYIDYVSSATKGSNKGIVSTTHKEYTEVTSRMEGINKNVYGLIRYFESKNK